MSRYLLLKGFNSYLNRVIKRYETAEEYQDAAEYSQYRDNMNFNPYDGVSAEVVVNYRAGEAMLTPDYIVVLNDTNQITGRYFVQEAVRQRNGQYRILLRRDLIADFKDTILDAPAFIEKATVNKISPFIFNSENMTYNQIKTENEILLKDETQVPWIVGYIAAPQPDEEDRTITATYDHDIDIRTNRTIEQFIADKNPGVIYKGSDWHYAVRVEGGTLGTVGGYEYSWYCNNTVSTAYIIPHQQYYRENGSTSSMRSSTLATFRTQGVATLTANGLGAMLNKNITTVENEESIWNLQGKIVKCGDILYALSVNKIRRNFTVNVSASVSQPIYAAMQSVCSSFKRGSQSTAPSSYKLVGSADEIQILYRELSDKRLTVQTSFGANRKVLNDAPYCMFAMPAETINWKAPDAVERTMDKTVSFALATAIAEQLTQSKCYDLQLLPYCPRQDLINGGKIDLSNSDLVHGADYLFIFPGDQFTAPSGFILFASKSAGTINIPINIAVPEDDVDFKIEDETTFYRLCSPNYAGQFEFKATRNYGVDFVNIDYAYKPFTPYIHANINFKGLYGADTDDTRGLICSGDFSLPQTSDK